MLKTLFLATLTSVIAFGQLPPAATWAVEGANHYNIRPNIVYGTFNNYEAKLDVYLRSDTTGPQPTVMFFHGGGWIAGVKESSTMALLPWMEMGWNVVNVEYRMARVSPAPAAVEDCLCALRWVGTHAKDMNFDVSRIVTIGESAGGHLALTTGMIPPSAGLDHQCPGGGFTANTIAAPPKPAGIISWSGITDLNDMLDGPNLRTYAVEWFGVQPDRTAMARRVSPMTYVRADLPPILLIHGDADPIVPYSQATRLRDALTAAGAQNQLLTIPGGKHVRFSPEERVKIFTTIHEFLAKNHLS
jgi:acetyl esterase/lipase